jgi:hypothetical protein
MFKDRKIVIATKHQKEQVIAPLLLKELGITSITTPQLDTDLLGTFTGEIDRTLSPIEAARKKCYLAMEQSNCTMAIASEGSFGPHPGLFLVRADDEILVLIDKENNLEIIAREISTQTNFDAEIITDSVQLIKFANKALFPSHALIMRNGKNSHMEIVKGINNWDALNATFHDFMLKYGKVYIETDMRASYNPTRMKVIEKVTVRLIEKIKSTCPQCKVPSFSITSVKRGLPCRLCNMPTQTPKSNIYTCTHCHFIKEETIANKQLEDPMYCNFCNP